MNGPELALSSEAPYALAGAKTETPESTPLLSVCMIVKNEQEHLSGCLQSIADVADEIIVLDTGSTDATRDIARDFGAVVHEHPWQNDFSLHRNQVLALASGKWVLSIDADERLVQESAGALRILLANTPQDVNGLRVQIRDYSADGSLNYTTRYPRLYRRIDGVHYEGIVHNQVHIPGKISDAPLVIQHFGYDLDQHKMRRKFKRTVSLLKKQMRANPDDPAPCFYLANTYSHYERHEQAVRYARKTIALLQQGWRSAGPFLPVWHTLASSLIALQDYPGARQACEEALSHKQDYLDAWYLLGRIGFLQQDFVTTGRAADRYLALHQKLITEKQGAIEIPLHSVGREHVGFFWQGLARESAGDMKGADAAYKKAVTAENADYVFAIEMIHNVFELFGEQSGLRVAQTACGRFGQDADFILLLAKQCARRDLFRSFREELFDPGLRVEGSRLGALGVALLALLQNDHSRAIEALFTAVHDGNSASVAVLSRLVFSSQIDLPPEVEEEMKDGLQAAAILHSAAAITDGTFDGRNIPGLSLPAGAATDDDISLMYHLSSILINALRGEIEEMLSNLQAACSALGVAFPETFDDITQLKTILIALHEASRDADRSAVSLLTIAVGYMLFSENIDVREMFEAAKKEDAERNGPPDIRLRWYLAYLFGGRYFTNTPAAVTATETVSR